MLLPLRAAAAHPGVHAGPRGALLQQHAPAHQPLRLRPQRRRRRALHRRRAHAAAHRGRPGALALQGVHAPVLAAEAKVLGAVECAQPGALAPQGARPCWRPKKRARPGALAPGSCDSSQTDGSSAKRSSACGLGRSMCLSRSGMRANAHWCMSKAGHGHLRLPVQGAGLPLEDVHK